MRKSEGEKSQKSTLKHIKRNYVLHLSFPQVFVNYKKLH